MNLIANTLAPSLTDCRLIGLLAILSIFAVLPAAAKATFPGKNGRVAFYGLSHPTIFSTDADGGDLTALSFGQ